MASPSNQSSPNSGYTPHDLPPGMRVEYNHDLDVSEGFLESCSPLQAALRDERLLRQFNLFDNQAKVNKSWFHILGVGSVLFALLALTSASMSFLNKGAAGSTVTWIWIIADAGSVIAIALVICNRVMRHRVRWCQAVFCRERLRQWHFQ